MGRQWAKTKTRDKSRRGRLQGFTGRAALLRGGGWKAGRAVKNTHTLHPVTTLLAYLEWLSRLQISGNGQKYIKLISRWMLSGVTTLHKSWFDRGGQGLNPLLPNAHSKWFGLDFLLFWRLKPLAGKSKISHSALPVFPFPFHEWQILKRRPEGSWQPLPPLIEGHQRSKVKPGPKAEKCCSERSKWEKEKSEEMLRTYQLYFLRRVRGSRSFCLFVCFSYWGDGCYLSRHPSRSAPSSAAGNISCQELSPPAHRLLSTVTQPPHPSPSPVLSLGLACVAKWG